MLLIKDFCGGKIKAGPSNGGVITDRDFYISILLPGLFSFSVIPVILCFLSSAAKWDEVFREPVSVIPALLLRMRTHKAHNSPCTAQIFVSPMVLPPHQVISHARLLLITQSLKQLLAITLDFCCSEHSDATKNLSSFYRSLRCVWNSTDLLVASLHWEIRTIYVDVNIYTQIFLCFFPCVLMHRALPFRPATAKFLWEPLGFGIEFLPEDCPLDLPCSHINSFRN